MISRWWHRVGLKHSTVLVRITIPLFSTDRGHLITCECGKVWAL